MLGPRDVLLTVALAHAASAAMAGEMDWSGYVSAEPRIFFQSPAFANQDDDHVSPSAVAAPELRYEWRDGRNRLTLVPFYRFDAGDDERTHGDLREANWLRVEDSWALRVGLGKVFWGVTESRHLVDIVNQTDLVEDIDEEDKLGQPMIHFERWTTGHGTFEAFVLPGFRERTFPDEDARLSGGVDIDEDGAEYESGAKDRRVDFALRWQDVIGAWDIGVSGFYGTSREPRLVPALNAQNTVVLTPHYDVIAQAGLDLQYTRGAWLWKLESIGRRGYRGSFGALVAGFEYTRFGVLDTQSDLGLLLEYLYDGRGSAEPETIFDNDVFVGSRLTLNDPEDTALLLGAVVDADGESVIAFVEAERRVAESWKLELEARL
ncbi:MAG: hypothetical protein P8Y95_02050, partial [Gammaproteobacteria bacterium]